MTSLDVFSKLPEAINELVSEFSSAPVVGDLGAGITQYSFWLLVSAIVLLVVVFTFVKKQTLVPKGLFVNGVEYLVEYVENDVAKGVVGTEWRKHFPFLATIFFFMPASFLPFARYPAVSGASPSSGYFPS